MFGFRAADEDQPAMNLRFQHERATQAAAHLLYRRGGTMSYMKLLKLLYLADRKALVEHGRPITFDRYVAMKHGPVLSQVYDLMVGEEAPDSPPSYWRSLISEPADYRVRLLHADPPVDALSPAQLALLDNIFDEFGAMYRWNLVRYVHTLPEWTDPHGSSVPISLRDVLRGADVDDDDAEAIESALRGESAMIALLDADE
jgi:uncharacterized phage-associated protein